MDSKMDERQQHRDTESLIMQAAEAEFLEKGYAGAKTTKIAERAGVTHAMLHYYFRTKEMLFEKIVSGKIEQLGEILLGAVGNPELPLVDRIREGIICHFDFLIANPLLPRFIINELALHPERINPIRDKLMAKASEVLSDIQKEIDALPGVNVDATMLLADIISLNVFPIVAAPMLKGAVGAMYGDYDKFLELRKQENIHTILSKLNLE